MSTISESYQYQLKLYMDNIHDDETHRPKYNWCPNCGCNACIVTWESRLGTRYRCICGLTGRFGDGLDEPIIENSASGASE